MIWSELKYLIGTKVEGTGIWDQDPGSTRRKNRPFRSGPVNNSAKTEQVGLLGGSWSGQGYSGWFQPGLKLGNPEPLLTVDRYAWTPPEMALPLHAEAQMLNEYNTIWFSASDYNDLTPKHKSEVEVSQWNGKEMK